MRLKRGGRKRSREIKEVLVIFQNMTKIFEVMGILISEQDKQNLLQFYEELKQQLSSSTHIFTSDQTLKEQDPSSNIT
ncbi:hypothetical protein GLOIN_2v1776936 [Rhizophagus irregularis DAOM 181602=DAOM 197198]|nr:hypothetical protein GLOIN_2v1776936 [Rhizophagus irregularis DAOM 181602=DAOM 197198]